MKYQGSRISSFMGFFGLILSILGGIMFIIGIAFWLLLAQESGGGLLAAFLGSGPALGLVSGGISVLIMGLLLLGAGEALDMLADIRHNGRLRTEMMQNAQPDD